MSIKIVYNSHPFDRENVGGISRYFHCLWQHLPKDCVPIVCIKESNNEYLKNGSYGVMPARNLFCDFLPNIAFRGKRHLYNVMAKYGYPLFHSSEHINDQCFRQCLLNGSYDLIHLTGVRGYEDIVCKYAHKVPIVITCHDLIPEIMYGDKARHRENMFAFKMAARIIAVSQHTKEDIIRRYDVDPQKIDVVYHGYTPNCQIESQECASCKYVLYVGKRYGYKNFDFFVKALAPLLNDDKSLRIICTGSPFTSKEISFLTSLGVQNQVVAEFVSEGHLVALYRHALAFVYPSLYEGFGLPILEAFSAKCPVVLARASCFPEVAGDAAIYFDPCDGAGLRSAIKKISHEDVRLQLVSRGLERLKSFSWERCAQETVAVYKRALDNFRGRRVKLSYD